MEAETMKRPSYFLCQPDPRMSKQPFWVCTHCGEPTYNIGDACAHWTENHMPKRPKRGRVGEKSESTFSRVMQLSKGDYKP